MTDSPAPATTMLYLVRHGATDANEQRPYILQGRTLDGSLSSRGRQQAEAVSRFLKRFELSRIYCSRMRRAIETARSIAEPHDVEIETIDELVECHVGCWEGMDWDSIMREFPDEYSAFMENPAENPYLDGESYGDVLDRTQPAIQQILERHPGESIAIVAHNVVNRVYLSRLLGLELHKAKDIRQSNCGVNVIRYRDGVTELMTLNADFHLTEPVP